jgi:hypothetical protein
LAPPNVRTLRPNPIMWISNHSFSDGLDFATLTHCRELRELEAGTESRLTPAHLRLISSITSTKIERIILTRLPAFDRPAGDSYWMELDDLLVKLVERLRYNLGLDMEFRDVSLAWHGKRDFGECLPMFVERGRITVIDVEGQLIYRSDEGGERK